MAKQVIKEPVRRTTISGIYADEITAEQIAAIIARNPNAAKLFEKKEVTE